MKYLNDNHIRAIAVYQYILDAEAGVTLYDAIDYINKSFNIHTDRATMMRIMEAVMTVNLNVKKGKKKVTVGRRNSENNYYYVERESNE